MGKLFVVADFEVAIRMIVESAFQIPKGCVDMAVRAGAEKDKLAAAIQAVRDGVKNKVHAFLMVQPADERDNWAELIPQPESISERFLVGIFIIDGLD